MNLAEVKFPFAYNENLHLVHVNNAKKEGKFYFDKNKSIEFILNKGKVKRPHFRTKVTVDSLSESMYHAYAKEILISLIKGNIDNKESLSFTNGEYKNIVFKPGEFINVKEEGSFTSVVADLVVTLSDNTLLAIEILHTHAMEDHKRAFYNDNNIMYFEIKTEDIIQQDADLSIIKTIDNNLNYIKTKRLILKTLNKYDIDLSYVDIDGTGGYFKVGLTQCWKNDCNEIIPVFAWEYDCLFSSGVINIDRFIDREFSKQLTQKDSEDIVEQTKKIPKTLKYRPVSKESSRIYIANVCPNCKTVQHRYKLKDSRLISLHSDFNERFIDNPVDALHKLREMLQYISFFNNKYIEKSTLGYKGLLTFDEPPLFEFADYIESIVDTDELQREQNIKNIAAFMTRH